MKLCTLLCGAIVLGATSAQAWSIDVRLRDPNPPQIGFSTREPRFFACYPSVLVDLHGPVDQSTSAWIWDAEVELPDTSLGPSHWIARYDGSDFSNMLEVPEPSQAVTLAAGALLLAWMQKRRHRP